MSDRLPTDEQLRRIQRGVHRRIGLRRRVAQRVAGGGVAVLLVVGGFALLRPVVGTTASGSGSAARSSSGFTSDAAPLDGAQAVRCHDGAPTTVAVDPSGLPTSALVACSAAQRRAATAAGRDADARATPPPSPSGAVLCRASDGALSVWPGGPATCRVHGLRRY